MTIRRIILLTLLLPMFLVSARADFDLVKAGRAATILVWPTEPECVRLAAQDLASDVRKITGHQPQLISRLEDCATNCVVIGSVTHSQTALNNLSSNIAASLLSKWEAYQVQAQQGSKAATKLLIAGSDERGAMFGVYAFIEQYLGVDPMYFWTDRKPQKRATLTWPRINIVSKEPTFRYRGWFINDEDLLTEWPFVGNAGGGKRELDYPYYHQVTAPEVLARVYEAALRLQYNLIIPASFADITNPAEERMIAEAVRRGLFVSMHHVEPMGVSAFGFQNYWRRKGREVPYSFISQRAEFEETWRHFAAHWAKYAPNVVWQLGLRGIADRPLWVTDPNAPKTDAERGKLISDAMQLQAEIVRSVDPRPQPPMTTTLWMEGAALNRQGHLRFPADVTVVFADNSPGWKWQADFYETKREPERKYGVYYHHALWSSGPHLAQAVPPEKTYDLLKLAVERNTRHYAILNVSNVREFALGLDASARMLREFEAFQPDRFWRAWCAARFGKAASQAEQVYRQYFGSFVTSNQTGIPVLLDGQTLALGKRFLGEVEKIAAAGFKDTRLNKLQTADWIRQHIPDMFAGNEADPRQLLAQLQTQRVRLEQTGNSAAVVSPQLSGTPKDFFTTNLIAQQQIVLGLVKWAEAAVQAALAAEVGKRDECGTHLQTAINAFAEIRSGQALAARGEWADWYRGDRKMNLNQAEALTRRLAQQINTK